MSPLPSLALPRETYWRIGEVTVNAFIEPQYTFWRNGNGVPRWQIFAGVNLQFSLSDLVERVNR